MRLFGIDFRIVHEYPEVVEPKVKVFCKDCVRWYFSSGADQCNIPSCGYIPEGKEDFFKAVGMDLDTDKTGAAFIKSHLVGHVCFASTKSHGRDAMIIYGCPSQLNKNNDCYFYKAKISKQSSSNDTLLLDVILRSRAGSNDVS